MNNNINFTGTFLIKRPTKTMRKEITELAGKRKMLFDFKPNNMLCVVRDSKDENIAKYILDRKLYFNYFPELNTASGFDIAHPDKAKAIIKEHTPVKKAKDLEKLFPKPVKKETKFSFIERSLRTFQFNEMNYALRSDKGIIHVFDKDTNKLIARISPPGKFGINYVHIEPKTIDDSPLRYALDKDGKIIFQYTSLSGAKQFSKNFAAALRHSKGMD